MAETEADRRSRHDGLEHKRPARLSSIFAESGWRDSQQINQASALSWLAPAPRAVPTEPVYPCKTCDRHAANAAKGPECGLEAAVCMVARVGRHTMLFAYEEPSRLGTAFRMISDWQASIAHADMADWVTVAAYLLAAILCTRAARHAWLQRIPRETLFWRLTAVLLLSLGINELLDLQTLLTMIGRAHAKTHGWYPEHRKIQYIFVVALAFGAFIFGAVILWLTRQMHYGVRLALGGLVFIGLFILLRAASFHHLDDILGRGATEFPLGSIQEMAGILLVAAAALLYSRGRRVARRNRGSRGD